MGKHHSGQGHQPRGKMQSHGLMAKPHHVAQGQRLNKKPKKTHYEKVNYKTKRAAEQALDTIVASEKEGIQSFHIFYDHSGKHWHIKKSSQQKTRSQSPPDLSNNDVQWFQSPKRSKRKPVNMPANKHK